MQITCGMHNKSNISANSKPIWKTLQVVNQELRRVLLAKPVYNKKSQASGPNSTDLRELCHCAIFGMSGLGLIRR